MPGAMADWIDFTGKVVLVTGSSRGIGAGLVSAFDKAGARCVVNYVSDADGRNLNDARAVAAGLTQPLLVECNVSDFDAVGRMMGEVERAAGGLDVLINNAGVLRDRTIKKMTQDDWRTVMKVNLDGAFHCIQQASRLLRPGGRVVNIASVSGQLGLFGQANYASSKAGLIALTKVAARELARQQVTVNAIAPGFVDTEMSRTMPQEVTKRFLEQVPLGRFGQVQDVVDAALFLCSPRAGYITGQVLNVNGGFYMG
jgi:3-oxoacyl-[acyl-carrier protein] reductase